MWRDDLTITANRNGLRLVSCSVLVVLRPTRRGRSGVETMACPSPTEELAKKPEGQGACSPCQSWADYITGTSEFEYLTRTGVLARSLCTVKESVPSVRRRRATSGSARSTSVDRGTSRFPSLNRPARGLRDYARDSSGKGQVAAFEDTALTSPPLRFTASAFAWWLP